MDTWGFDTHSIEHSVRPQDDFYRFANGNWIQKNKIPSEENRWGSFQIVKYNTDQQIKQLFTALIGKQKLTPGSTEQLVRDMYVSAFNMKERNARGSTPLDPYRADIRAITSHAALLRYLALAHRDGSTSPWMFALDQDAKKSDVYLFTLWQGGLGMPEREYYLQNTPEHTRVREAYKQHIKKLFTIAQFPKNQIANAVDTVMSIETRLARISMKKEDTRDAEKTYHVFSITQLERTIPQIPWKTYLRILGAKHIKRVNVAQPSFFIEIGKLLFSIPLPQWKIYFEWHLLNDHAALLSEPFVREHFAFYGKILTGSIKMKPLWRRALNAVDGTVGEALGALYVHSYFHPEAKRKMDLLVSDLFDVYETRIRKLTWMSSNTKRNAIRKLHTMRRKIGYPSRFETYKGLLIKPDDFFGNMLRAHTFHHKKAIRKSKHPVDRKEWFMTPQTVNAYYHSNLNEIVFPAAILQEPFFSFTADDAVNYGAIGSIIGHEITHGFDDQGSKFDYRGNLKSWWTKKDREAFLQRGKKLVQQFNTYQVTPTISVNGALTLGENIADLGGLVIAFEAYQKRLQKTGRSIIDGFTPEERFFLGFAQCERTIARSEFLKMQVLVDPHAPSFTRINGPLSNFSPFYTTFKVCKRDKLYRDQKNRVEIW